MSRPLWGKGDRASGGRGELASYLDCLPTSPPTPTTTTQTKSHYTCKAIQIRKRAPPLRALTGPPLPKGRGLLYEPRLYLYRKQLIVATAKQEPEMSRPLWGKGDRVSGGRRELASNIDCLTTNAPTPTTAVQTNRITHGRPYNTAIERPPLRALTGPPLPKGRGFSLRRRCMYYCAKFVSEYHR